MPRGGKRNGAGRPKGPAVPRDIKVKEVVPVIDREIREAAAVVAEKVIEEKAGPEPLDVLLEAMWFYLEKKDYVMAGAFAKHAAPYRHPRLEAITVGGPDGGDIPVGMRFVRSPLRVVHAG